MADILIVNWKELRKYGLVEKIIKNNVPAVKFDDAKITLESIVFGLTDKKQKAEYCGELFEKAISDLLTKK